MPPAPGCWNVRSVQNGRIAGRSLGTGAAVRSVFAKSASNPVHAAADVSRYTAPLVLTQATEYDVPYKRNPNGSVTGAVPSSVPASVAAAPLAPEMSTKL